MGGRDVNVRALRIRLSGQDRPHGVCWVVRAWWAQAQKKGGNPA